MTSNNLIFRYVQLFSQNVANNLIPANIYVLDAEKNLEFISCLDSKGYELSKNLDDSAYCMYTGGKNGQQVIYLLIIQ